MPAVHFYKQRPPVDLPKSLENNGFDLDKSVLEYRRDDVMIFVQAPYPAASLEAATFVGRRMFCKPRGVPCD